MNVKVEEIKGSCLRCKTAIKAKDKRHLYCSKECRDKLKKCICKKCDYDFYAATKIYYCSDECRQTQCINCDNIFTWSSSPKEKYCSSRCKSEHLTRECGFCKVVFEARSVGVKYCSSECGNAYKSLKRGFKLCKQCGNAISYAKDYFALDYCNDHCRDSYIKDKHSKKLKGDKKERVQDVEGIVTYRVESIINRKLEFMRTMSIGLDYNLIDSFNDSMRENILIRDEYSCYICEDDRELEVHHILPRKFGGNNEDSNLVTLCIRCHRAVETGNLEHAVFRCVERAKKNLGLLKEKTEMKMSRINFIETLTDELNGVFNNINEGEPQEEILLKVDDLLYAIENWKSTKY